MCDVAPHWEGVGWLPPGSGGAVFTRAGEGVADNKAGRRDGGPCARTWVKCKAIGRAFQGVKMCGKAGQ